MSDVKDQDKSKTQLIAELVEMRRRVAAAEAAEVETRRTAAELAGSKAILEATIESLPLDFFAIGTDGRYRMQNATGKMHWGDAIGKRPEDAAGSAENLAIWRENNRRAFAGEKVEGEVELTVNGEPRSAYNVVAPIRENGRIAGIVGINIDITERKRAEEAVQKAHDELEAKVKARTAELTKKEAALRQTTDKLQAIYDGMVDGLLLVDRETLQIVRANASIGRMLGYSPEQLLSMSVHDIHPVGQLPTTPEAARAEAEGRIHVHQNAPLRRRDGSIFYADIVNNYVDYAGRHCVICFYRDITERKRAEEALRQSRDELQAIYEGMLEGLLILDSETKRIVEVNSSFCRMLGYTEREMLAMPITDIHPADDVARCVERIYARAEGRVEEDTSVPMLRKDGSIFYADVMGNNLTYGGRPCVLGLFRDITERKLAQAALERERRTLKHLLQSSDHERQLIAYEIHDGLAQYLAGSMMQFDVYNHLKEMKPKEAAKAYDAGMTMLRQGHADARRLISGVRPPILDEEGIVAAIWHLVSEHRGRKAPTIEFHSDVAFNRLVPILENAVYRIAQEALTNACQHSKSDRIRVEMVQHDDHLRIVVQDWGIGFDPNEVGEDRFGLAGMRERARLLGGRISVESAPGEGTRITAELPLVVRS